MDICRSTSEPLWVSMSNLKSCLKRFWIYHSLYAFTLPVKIKSHGAKNHKKSWPPDSLKYENEKNENRCKQLFDDDHFGIWRWMSHRGSCSTSTQWWCGSVHLQNDQRNWKNNKKMDLLKGVKCNTDIKHKTPTWI